MKHSKHILGLIGRNVGYSWSPLIHNTASNLLGLPYEYTIFNVATTDLLGDALRGTRALGISGLNVTIPYKKDVVGLLDEVSEEARSIGAVNTIVNTGDRLSGHNTDIEGFAAPLLPYRNSMENRPVCVVGSGGAALAAIEAFRRFFRPSAIYLFVRNPLRAKSSLEHVTGVQTLSICLLDDLYSGKNHAREQLRSCSVVVNATPIGTAGRTRQDEETVIPDGKNLLHSDQIVYDMVYNPPRTPLLSEAEKAGAETISGIRMLVAQASRSFSLWTGRSMPEADVTEALLRHVRTSAWL